MRTMLLVPPAVLYNQGHCRNVPSDKFMAGYLVQENLCTSFIHLIMTNQRDFNLGIASHNDLCTSFLKRGH